VGCCSTPVQVVAAPVETASCCSADATVPDQKLSDLLSRYNVNDYAASVKVFAVK
jgi:hypothetical protein